jgi:glucose-6-phosphate 1-dehydrogenase
MPTPDAPTTKQPLPTLPVGNTSPSAPGVHCAPPCTLVIFGAGGDLTKRLLTPSIYNRTMALGVHH